MASALASSIGFLMRHRGAVAAPDVDVRRPLRTIVALFRERWWAIGYAVAVAAWLLYVVGLKFAPLSLMQVTLATGFVFLGVAAERLFGIEVGRRQWAGIGLATAGLALLGGTAGQANPNGSESGYAVPAAIAVEAGLVAVGVALIASPRVRRAGDQCGLFLAAGAGLLFTVSHIGIKALSRVLSLDDAASFATPWLPLVAGAFVVAFFASARSLQLGNAVSVIAVTAATSNVSAIFGGIVVFRDPVGDNGLIIAVRMVAFALVVIAAALMPAPVRAAHAAARRELKTAAAAG